MGFLDKFINKFTNRASDKLADKAINKIFGKNDKTQNSDKPIEQTQPTENIQPLTQTQEVEKIQATTIEPIKVPVMDPSQVAMMGAMMGQGMAQANEIMKYLILNDDMEVIGVKDDAPDYLKIAYKNGKLNNKD